MSKIAVFDSDRPLLDKQLVALKLLIINNIRIGKVKKVKATILNKATSDSSVNLNYEYYLSLERNKLFNSVLLPKYLH